MSDEEDYEYEYDDEEMEEANDFEYSDGDDEQDDGKVALENAYYNAKGLRETDLQQAAQAFEQVIHQEQQKIESKCYGPWSFKAIKQLVKLHLRAGDAENARKHYSRLLECISTGKDITPNAVEKGISGMLERVASLYQQQSSAAASATGTTSSSVTTPPLAVAVYDETLQVFHPQTGACKNERLWFKANIKYGQLLYEMHNTAKLQTVLKDLQTIQRQNAAAAAATASSNRHPFHQEDNENSNSSSGSSTQTMEIYALQIQLYSRQKDHKSLRETFKKAMNVRGGIPHPRTLALMQELGGKMHMSAREYEAAGKTFFQAFKSYDEAGDPSRLRCLKYLVLASMLHASTINPFDSQEARPYRDDPEIVAMTNLVQAFQNNEIHAFEKILRKNQGHIMEDEFVREHIEDLLRTVRRQVLRRVIRPYKRIALQAIARELNDIPVEDVEILLVGLILDGSLDGKIDRVAGVLLKQAEKGESASSRAGTSGAAYGGAAADTVAAMHNKPKSMIDERCLAMEDMISRLEELSTHVTSMRVKEGPAMRGMV